ncbi:hypothetical protein PTKIN_Ptkin10aG0126900 [Pterospermum kingtungense]
MSLGKPRPRVSGQSLDSQDADGMVTGAMNAAICNCYSAEFVEAMAALNALFLQMSWGSPELLWKVTLSL